MIDPVLCKGVPREDTFHTLTAMAEVIAEKQKENGFV